ncbi:F0F1 ATP synthase subunit A [Aestuariimicrobium sp. T2.26MG-19.2B]|uniref:F0F1 ATP synthase subunit A n=1 Tax=Aestuariimicrobium sp. T2.26MG-19.2B TaxID=3040679 RepID=UPI0024773E53|nr:F0F1 ATP synthase subunit A [Aestuariimicrobium sp. T2.26MG-19.2B]CAI9410401.1 ATP synthase subunit a [Aestuariimicrobium sp. T2.26MG-19.2B]
MLIPFLPLETAGHGGGYHAPSVEDFYFENLFGVAQVDRVIFQAVLGAVIVVALWWLAARRLRTVPTKSQFISEYLYDFVRNGIARDLLGHDYRKFLPYLLGLFSFILVNNLFGQFFLFMFPTFSRVGFAYGLALLTWLIYIGAGLKRHGLTYIKNSLLPSGVPWYLWVLIIPLEFLSNFITRPITLALRLFANLFAGHLVVSVFVVGGAFLLQYQDNLFYNISGGVSLLFSFAILCLELFVGSLQAYIFTVLTAQYISSSLAESH